MRPLASTPSNICRRESFLSGSHFSAVFASFSGLSPPFGSLVASPVGVVIEGEADLSVFLPIFSSHMDGHLLPKALKYFGHRDLVFSRQGLSKRTLEDIL